MSGLHARHQRLAELTGPWQGWLVDLGCGRGATLACLLQHAHDGARLLGVDRDRDTLAHAAISLAHTPWVGLLGAELAAPLPIASASIDRVVCHNLLECLPDPARLLAEVARILRPGGRAIIGHSDFDTLVWAGADLTLTRRLVHAYCDTQQAWMDAADGTIGRRLPALVAASPLQLDQIHALVVLEDAFTPDALGFILARGAARIAARVGACTQAEADGWLAELSTAHTQGRYLFSVNDYIVAAAKPSADHLTSASTRQTQQRR